MNHWYERVLHGDDYTACGQLQRQVAYATAYRKAVTCKHCLRLITKHEASAGGLL